MKVQYICSTEAIRNIKESNLAKSEMNDCVVRAFATAFDLEYDEAHQKVKEIFCRKPRKGTTGFHYGMNMMDKNKTTINGKTITKITHEHNTMLYYVTVKGFRTLRNTTTSYFLKRYPVGTYIVTVRRHSFTIKDGVVIGNHDDGRQMRKVIDGVWKIG
jgi:hypothetical protein